MRIESRAPTRIDLAGGTLDIWPLYLFHEGSLTVNCAITRYASCVIETAPEPSRRIVLVSRDIRRKESFRIFRGVVRGTPLQVAIARATCEVFRPASGFTLTTDSEAPAGAGIGGSSAMAVAICAALDRLTGAGLRREDWIHISRDVEAIVIRVPTGTQDHYPPAFGGAAAIVLAPGGERREALAAISTNSSAGWSCATQENPGSTESITGKYSSGTSTATVAWRKIWKKFQSSPKRCASRSRQTSGLCSAAWFAKNGNSAAAIFKRFQRR